MKHISGLLIFLCMVAASHTQSVGIGTTSPHASAQIDVSSTTKGILVPRMTSAQRGAIAAPAQGLLVYDTDTNSFWYHNGTIWTNLAGNGSGVFTVTNGAVHNTGSIATDHFIFGRTSLPPNDQDVIESMFFFNKNKAAFRAGYASAKNWSDDSIGLNSIALGSGVRATKGSSVAIGNAARATGNYSVAMGSGVVASGENSVAFGSQPTLASGTYAFAAGGGAKAYGQNSTALGYGVAEATNSFAANTSTAKGIYGAAFGNNSIAQGNSAFAAGARSAANGDYAVALGYENSSIGSQSVSIGEGNLAIGNKSVALGAGNIAQGNNSVAMGGSSESMGFGSIAGGVFARSVGNYSLAFGLSNVARAYGSMVVGMYNDTFPSANPNSNTSTDPVFIVGNGTAHNSRNNAMTILKNGRVGIGVDNPGHPLDLNGRMRLRHNGNSSGIWYNKDDNATAVFAGLKTNTQWGVYGSSWQFYFDVADGQAYKSSGSTAWIVASDERLKENIHPYSDGLNQVMQINPVWFNYKKESGYESSKPYVGVLAQEVKETAPYMVGEFEKDGQQMLNLDNTAMTYMLVNAIKEQQAQIETLKKELAKLKEKK